MFRAAIKIKETEVTLSPGNEYMVVIASDKDSRVEIYSIKIEDLSYV